MKRICTFASGACGSPLPPTPPVLSGRARQSHAAAVAIARLISPSPSRLSQYQVLHSYSVLPCRPLGWASAAKSAMQELSCFRPAEARAGFEARGSTATLPITGLGRSPLPIVGCGRGLRLWELTRSLAVSADLATPRYFLIFPDILVFAESGVGRQDMTASPLPLHRSARCRGPTDKIRVDRGRLDGMSSAYCARCSPKLSWDNHPEVDERERAG